jgi:CRP-like cAMP-binding protein
MDSEKYLALKRVDMLAQLSDAELWELTQAGRWTRVAAKQAIIRENDPGQSFFFLAQGQVKVTLEGRLLNTISEGEGFGEMAYIRGGDMPRHATVETMTAILLAEFEPQALARMSLGAQLHLTRALARNLVDRLDLANERFFAK